MDPHPDAAAFWDRHLDEVAGHELDLARRHDRVGLVLTVLAGGGSVATALGMQAAGTWAVMGGFADLLAALGLLLAAVTAVVAGAGLVPMDGRGWRPGTFPAWLRDRTRYGFQVEALAGLFPDATDEWRSRLHRASRVRDDLADKVRSTLDAHEGSTVAGSPDARRVLAEYLLASFHTDLAWWLEPADATPEALHLAETRVRLVFWFWTRRQVAEARADLVHLAVRLGTLAAALLGSAFAVHLLGWWMLAAVALVAVLVILRLFLGRSQGF